jgi:hypothetical protein
MSNANRIPISINRDGRRFGGEMGRYSVLKTKRHDWLLNGEPNAADIENVSGSVAVGGAWDQGQRQAIGRGFNCEADRQSKRFQYKKGGG